MRSEPRNYRDLEHMRAPSDPTCIGEICFPSQSTEAVLRRWTERQGYVTNILFHGLPGSGKSRAAYTLCKERSRSQDQEWNPIDYIECESSTFEPVIRRLRTLRLAFQRLDSPDFEQLIILDEVDNYNSLQQKQLKSVMERNDLAFLLITNDVGRIDDGVRNRCLEVPWYIPAPALCLPRLRSLANAVGAAQLTDADLLQRLYSKAGWRQMCRNLDLMTSNL